MTDQAEAVVPLTIDAVDRLPLGGGRVVLRIHGRWRGAEVPELQRTALVVEAAGERHEFPAIPQLRRTRAAGPDAWSSSFAIPAWLEPQLPGAAILMLDDLSVPLPPVSGEPPPDLEAGTVAALRAALSERAQSEAQLRGRLADAAAELEARAGVQARLEVAHGELRAELAQLGELVEGQDARRAEVESRAITLAAQVARLEEELAGARAAVERERERTARELAELRTGLASSEVAREAALSEASGLRSELERLGGDLAAAREHVGEREGGLGEAEALLAEARALRTRILERGDGGAQTT
jgi:hypothetical protein